MVRHRTDVGSVARQRADSSRDASRCISRVPSTFRGSAESTRLRRPRDGSEPISRSVHGFDVLARREAPSQADHIVVVQPMRSSARYPDQRSSLDWCAPVLGIRPRLAERNQHVEECTRGKLYLVAGEPNLPAVAVHAQRPQGECVRNPACGCGRPVRCASHETPCSSRQSNSCVTPSPRSRARPRPVCRSEPTSIAGQRRCKRSANRGGEAPRTESRSVTPRLERYFSS